jgi:thioester reductase-like protein
VTGESDRGGTGRERVTVLTGATGFLGREILASLLGRAPREHVLAPVRPSRGRSGAERLAALLEELYPDPAAREQASRRVRPVETDLARDDESLEDALRAGIAGRPWRIIHGAASVAFDLALPEARRINVAGTQRLFDLAERLARETEFERFCYVGTAFVAGDRSGVVREDELDCGQGFTNTYERSKLEAERLVRSYAGRLPISVFRPSIIAGHSASGATASFKVLYWPLKVLVRGWVLLIPGDPDSCHDIVPVDFVADALLHIAERKDSVGGCYHLTAGRSVTLRRALEIAAECFDLRRVPPVVSPRRFYAVIRPVFFATLWGPMRRVMNVGDVYVPYLSKRLVFDNRATAAALVGSGLRLPDVEAYLRTVFEYAKQSDFGSRAV